MGNGRRISCFDVPWLPRLTSFKHFTRGPSHEVAVRELFLVQWVWDDVVIDHMFLPIDRDLIKAIPLSFSPCEDRLNGIKKVSLALRRKLTEYGSRFNSLSQEEIVKSTQDSGFCVEGVSQCLSFIRELGLSETVY